MRPPTPAWSRDGLRDVIARHWGFRELRPLQDQAMAAVLDGKDSLVVLPTGGGKSLSTRPRPSTAAAPPSSSARSSP